MEIREPEEKDLAGLSELVLRVYDESPQAITFDHRPGAEELAEMLNKKLEGIRNREIADLVATDSGKVVADCEIVKTTDSGGVVGIIVAKEYRMLGIGKTLLDKCAKKARELKMLEIYVEIDEKNEDAYGFFSRCGFKEQVEGKKLIMVKNL